MKNTILMKLSFVAIMLFINVNSMNGQAKMEPWPGVTKKILTDNEKVSVAEVTFAPGAVADWHSHPQYSVYAVTAIKMKVEVKDKETVIVEMKPGDAGWSEAVTHKTTNVGKKPFTAIVTELK